MKRTNEVAIAILVFVPMTQLSTLGTWSLLLEFRSSTIALVLSDVLLIKPAQFLIGSTQLLGSRDQDLVLVSV